MDDGNELKLSIEYLGQTDLAFYVSDHKGGGIWIPKSQVRDVNGSYLNFNLCKQHDCFDILIPEWLAIEKDLI